LVALLVFGCASTKDEWRSTGYLVTDRAVPGCIRFGPGRFKPFDRTAIASAGLTRELLSILETASIRDDTLAIKLKARADSLMCWYEQPDNDLRLRIGDECDWPMDVTFHRNDHEWSIVRVQEWFAQCELRRR